MASGRWMESVWVGVFIFSLPCGEHCGCYAQMTVLCVHFPASVSFAFVAWQLQLSPENHHWAVWVTSSSTGRELGVPGSLCPWEVSQWLVQEDESPAPLIWGGTNSGVWQPWGMISHQKNLQGCAKDRHCLNLFSCKTFSPSHSWFLYSPMCVSRQHFLNHPLIYEASPEALLLRTASKDLN